MKMKKGFTLIELTLAVSFIATLMVMISVVTMHITEVYQKGLSMTAVNSTGKQLADDFMRSIHNTPIRSLTSYCGKYSGTVKEECVSDNARKFVYQEKYGTVKINGEDKSVPIYGAFCTGRYSYVWNTGYALNSKIIDDDSSDGTIDATFVDGTGKRAVKKSASGELNADFRLVKVLDSTRQVCTEHMTSGSYGFDDDSTYNFESLDETDLLADSEDDLVLYDMTVYKPAEHHVTHHAYYAGTFILATLHGNVDITGSGEFCTDAPDGLATDFNYCEINKFSYGTQ